MRYALSCAFFHATYDYLIVSKKGRTIHLTILTYKLVIKKPFSKASNRIISKLQLQNFKLTLLVRSSFLNLHVVHYYSIANNTISCMLDIFYQLGANLYNKRTYCGRNELENFILIQKHGVPVQLISQDKECGKNTHNFCKMRTRNGRLHAYSLYQLNMLRIIYEHIFTELRECPGFGVIHTSTLHGLSAVQLLNMHRT